MLPILNGKRPVLNAERHIHFSQLVVKIFEVMMGLGNFVNFLKFDWETVKKSRYAILYGHLPFRTGNSNPPFDYLILLQGFSSEE